jgi:8-oxo-dGTP pyrophosphatase MutT (NUDIX family)
MDGIPWKNYREKMNDRRPEMVIPTCSVSNRWDGTMGLIGGMVDGEDSFEETVKHEAFEEAGYKIQDRELEEIVAHDIGSITTHAFACQLSYEELKDIQVNISKACDLGSEVTGVFLPHLVDYEKQLGKNGGIIEFLKTSMAPSVREEIIHFLLKKNIFSKEDLINICTKAGYNLEDLIK